VDQLIASTKALYSFETAVTQVVSAKGCRVTTAMVEASAYLSPSVIIAFGFRGGVVTPDLVDALKETSGLIKSGAASAAKDVGVMGKSVWAWGKQAMADLGEKSERAAEVRRAKERERLARQTMEQMRRSNAEKADRARQQQEFLAQQREVLDEQLQDQINGGS
jgi:hypothetical protein